MQIIPSVYSTREFSWSLLKKSNLFNNNYLPVVISHKITHNLLNVFQNVQFFIKCSMNSRHVDCCPCVGLSQIFSVLLWMWCLLLCAWQEVLMPSMNSQRGWNRSFHKSSVSWSKCQSFQWKCGMLQLSVMHLLLHRDSWWTLLCQALWNILFRHQQACSRWRGVHHEVRYVEITEVSLVRF